MTPLRKDRSGEFIRQSVECPHWAQRHVKGGQAGRQAMFPCYGALELVLLWLKTVQASGNAVQRTQKRLSMTSVLLGPGMHLDEIWPCTDVAAALSRPQSALPHKQPYSEATVPQQSHPSQNNICSKLLGMGRLVGIKHCVR